MIGPRSPLEDGVSLPAPITPAPGTDYLLELRSEKRFDAVLAGVVFALGLVLYVGTLAPTFTWGDDVTLTIEAVQGTLRASAGSHPLWILLAHLMTQLPVGDAAYRVNLLSALAAATTLSFLYLSMRLLRISRPAALAGGLAFGVSHTFWAHAVRAEVYTITMLMLAVLLWTALAWWRSGRERYLALLGLSASAALSAHVLTLLYLPGLIWLLSAARRPRLRGIALLLGCAAIGAAPLGMLLARDKATLNTGFLGLLGWALFTFEGYDFSNQMFRFSASALLPDATQWFAYLVYQFAGIGFLLMIIGAVSSWRRWQKSVAACIALIYGVSAVFAFAYDVGDRYVFYLPSYLPAAIWLALGADEAFRWAQRKIPNVRVRHVSIAALTILLFCVPVVSYRLAPVAMQRVGFQFRSARYVPGPNSRSFLPWPAKAEYYDARLYAEGALAASPQNALLLADPILASPLQYLQKIEGERPDIVVRHCCRDLDAVLAQYPNRPIVLADIAPDFYPMKRLQQEYTVLRIDPVYLLRPRP